MGSTALMTKWLRTDELWCKLRELLRKNDIKIGAKAVVIAPAAGVLELADNIVNLMTVNWGKQAQA